MSELKYSELTGDTIGCAMEVHRFLGCGFQEYIYQRALAIELTKRKIRFEEQFEMNVLYKGDIVGKRIVDFFIDKKIMLEIKAVTMLEDVHIAQALNYLEASGSEVGLIINFGSKSLQFKRLFNKRFQPNPINL
jgi:GxxExxY protein